jgi:hypothetical protein
MKIENLKLEKKDGRTACFGTVIWEASDRPVQEIFFGTDEEFSEDFTCNPHAFLVGCLIPAFKHGEKRILIDEEICPELRDNLMTALSWIRNWYYLPDQKLLKIEGKKWSKSTPLNKSRKAGMFFSGGVDSLAGLRYNNLNYPSDHPASIKDALFIYGQNVESDNRPEIYEKAIRTFSKVVDETGITIVPVYTNIRSLDEDSTFFADQFHGAILGAVAHTFVKRLGVVFISATDDIPSLVLQGKGIKSCKPWGSHPMLDPNYSSTDLRIRHDALHLSRFDKMKIVAGWDAGLQIIKVCGDNFPGENCGICEKCIRTSLALLALGVLDKTDAFPLNDISEDHVADYSLRLDTDYDWTNQHQYLELIPPLADIGRQDLVRAVEQLVELSRNPKKSLKTKVWEFDQKHLDGSLTKIKKQVFFEKIKSDTKD